MSAHLDATVEAILRDEGGIADVGDGAGLTRFGQTAGWLAQWDLAPPDTREQARHNYLKWLALTKLDQVCEVSPTIGHVVADYAVNSGEDRAIKALQRALLISPEGVDGLIGPVTIGKLHAMARSPETHERIRLNIIGLRLVFLGRIITDQLVKLRKEGKLTFDKKTHGEQAAGWMNRNARLL